MSATQVSLPSAPVVRAWWPGHGVLVVTAQCHLQDSSLPGTVEVQSQSQPSWRAALRSAVVRARLTEPLDPTGTRVTLELTWLNSSELAAFSRSTAEPSPQPADRDIGVALAESAAVLADRAARQLFSLSPEGAWVLARCRDWELGQLQPLPEPWHRLSLDWLTTHSAAPDAAQQAPMVYFAGSFDPANAVLPNWRSISQLRQLHGQLEVGIGQGPRVRSFEAWFPTIGARGAELASVRVVLVPAKQSQVGQIEMLGISNRGEKRERTEAVLRCARRRDPLAARWRTFVHFSTGLFQGNSFELALAVADRIARGREWPGAGRVIATGAIDAKTGAVLNVRDSPPRAPGSLAGVSQNAAEFDSKLNLLQHEAKLHDTVLLPEAWRPSVRRSDLSISDSTLLSFAHLHAHSPFARPQVVFVSSLSP